MPAQTADAVAYPPAGVIKVNRWLTLRAKQKNGSIGSLHEAVGFAANTWFKPFSGESRDSNGRSGFRPWAAFFLYHFRHNTRMKRQWIPMTENSPGSKREPVFNIPLAILATVLFLVAVHAAVVFFPNISFLQNVVYKASFVPTSFQQSPGSMSFTLVTYSSLHADWTHLLNNCAWLVAFGSPVAYVLGLRRFILFWCLCSAVAALTHFLLHPLSAVPMVGASGAVSGMMGAAARAGLKLRVGPNSPFSDLPFPTIVEALASRNVVVFILVYLMVNIGIGLSEVFMPGMSNIAWQAHIGGLLAGFLLFPRFVPQRMS